jgi:HAD superfamily hydrolase (TIGR01490 family)
MTRHPADSPAPRLAAFDVDETLITMKSMVSFVQFLSKHGHPEIGEEVRTLRSRYGSDRAGANRAYYRLFAGWPLQHLDALGETWFSELHDSPGFWSDVVVQRLRRDVGDEMTPVIVSGSFHALIDPIAHALGIHHILCTEQEASIPDGILTGNITAQSIGPSKRERLLHFSESIAADLRGSSAYGDDSTDLPMLRLVGTGYLYQDGNLIRVQ